jgi:hypothetical protein
MKRIIVISFKDVDVSDGLDKLVKKYPEATVCFPVTGDDLFFQSVVQVCQDNNSKIHCFIPEMGDDVNVIPMNDHKVTVSQNPVKELLRHVNSDDVLALVWDDSIECHMALHSVEDYGLEAWDITEGLDPIEVDYTENDVHSEMFVDMMDSVQVVVEKMTLYITASILESLNQVIGENLESLKDIDPFDE